MCLHVLRTIIYGPWLNKASICWKKLDAKSLTPAGLPGLRPNGSGNQRQDSHAAFAAGVQQWRYIWGSRRKDLWRRLWQGELLDSKAFWRTNVNKQRGNWISSDYMGYIDWIGISWVWFPMVPYYLVITPHCLRDTRCHFCHQEWLEERPNIPTLFISWMGTARNPIH